MSQTENTGNMRLDELKLMAHGIPDPRLFESESDLERLEARPADPVDGDTSH